MLYYVYSITIIFSNTDYQLIRQLVLKQSLSYKVYNKNNYYTKKHLNILYANSIQINLVKRIKTGITGMCNNKISK